jgi:hypothetical protein
MGYNSYVWIGSAIVPERLPSMVRYFGSVVIDPDPGHLELVGGKDFMKRT